ncbi:MAG TPA: TVP38/TMEM64 family protein [Solirubrobacteraceae bacterium]|nr:TVP38/TMEM64 family protein [Solirubrobacteraceae bacterium]
MAVAFALVAGLGDLSAARVRDWVEDAGVWAPVAFVAISAALTVAFFPGPLLAGASGLLFGTALGFPLSLCAAVLGASAAFLLARAVGRDAVERVAGPRVRAVGDAVSRRGFLAILYARILPGVPYSLVNYGAGLTTIRLPVFAAATALGAAPRAFAYTALGGSLDDLGSPEAIAAIAVLVVMAIGGVIAFRRSGSGAGSSSPASPTAGLP